MKIMIQDEIRGWVQECAAAGKSFSQMVLPLALEHGYSIPVAKRIVNLVLRPGSDNIPVLYSPPAAVPEIRTQEQRTTLEMNDVNPSISFEQFFPRIVLIDKLLSAAECETLCHQGMDLLAPAEIIDRDSHGQQTEIRSSFTARFPRNHTELVDRIEARIGQLVDWPLDNSEQLQIQRYLPGQQYVPHFDFFEQPGNESNKFIAQGGQRLATLIIYLRQPEAGGATYFSNLGMRVAPRAGSALFFSYPNPGVSSGTMHCGERVLSGEKWILTKWFRQRAPQSVQ